MGEEPDRRAGDEVRAADGGDARRARTVRRGGRRRGRRIPLRFLIPVILILVGGGTAVFFATRPDAEARLQRSLEIALDLVNRKEYRLARKTVEGFLAERPDDPRGDYLLGICQCFTGEETAGIERVESALRRRPRLLGAHLFLARYYSANEYLEVALEHAVAATEAEAARLEGRILESLGRLAEASSAYSKARRRDLDDFPLLFAALGVNRVLAARLGDGGSLFAQRADNLVEVISREVETRLREIPGEPEALLALARIRSGSPGASPEDLVPLWRAARDADVSSVAALQGLAAHLRSLGEVDEAVRVLEAGREASGRPEAWLALADLLLVAGRADEALSVAVDARERWPVDPALVVAHGALLFSAGRAGDAAAVLDAGLENHPENVPLLEMSGDVRAAQGDREGAEARYLRARDLKPRRLSLYGKLIALRIDDLLAAVARGGELPAELVRTRDLLGEFLELNRRDRQGLLWTASLSEARGRHELALNQLEDLLLHHPDELKARSMRARILLQKQDHAGAAAELAIVVASPLATVEDFLMYSRAALAFGKQEDVVEACGRGIERWPGEAQLHAYRGEALLRMGQGDRLVEFVAAAPEQVRHDPQIEKLVAWALVQAKDVADAELRFRALLSEGRVSPGEFARFLFEVGRPEEANRFLREEIDRHPDSAEARIRMARSLLEGGDREGARELYREAVRAEPTNLIAILGYADLLLSEPRERDVDGELSAIVKRLGELPNGAEDALYVEGRRRLRKGDGAGAAEKLGRLVKVRPDRYEAHLHLATAYLLQGRTGEAQAELAKSIDLRPGDPEAKHRLAALIFRSAAVRLAKGDPEGARALYEKLLAVREDDQPTRMMLGYTFLALGLPGMTEEQCEKILARNPGDAVARLVLAMARARQNRLPEALRDLDLVVAAEPDHPVVRAMRGMARIDVADGAGALEDFDAAESNGYRGVAIPYGRAHAYLMLGDRDRALAVAEAAAKANPVDPLVWRLVGEIRTARKEYEAAADAMLRGHEITPGDQWFLAGAVSLLASAGKTERAAAVLDGVSDPTSILLAAEGDLERARGNLARAEELYREAAVEDPRMLVRLARMAEERGDEEAEFRHYAAARERGVDAAGVRFVYGALLLSRGETRKAREELEAVAILLPDHVAVLNNLALAHLGEGGDPVRAVRIARKAVSLAPADARMKDTLGWVLLATGKASEAVPILKESTAALDTAEARYHLGAALAASGRADEARALLSRALREEPEAIWSKDAARRVNALK